MCSLLVLCALMWNILKKHSSKRYIQTTLLLIISKLYIYIVQITTVQRAVKNKINKNEWIDGAYGAYGASNLKPVTTISQLISGKFRWLIKIT